MKRGCLLALLQLGALIGLYYLIFHGRLIPPADLIGALGGGFGLLLVIGAFRNAWSARKGRALLDLAFTGAPLEDGRRIAVVGPILALGAPIAAPFSDSPCVGCSWDVSHKNTSPASNAKNQDVKDFSGFVMTPGVVQAPTGNVRILGFPVLEGFPKEVRRGDAAFKRARAYLESASFETIGVSNAFSEIEDLILDGDGRIRKDWRMAGEEFRLDPNLHTLNEQVVKDGQMVCAFGLYSAEKAALVSGYGRGGVGIKLIQGSGESARNILSTKFWQYLMAGVILFLVTHYLLMHLVLLHKVPSAAELEEALGAVLFQAVKDEDMAAVTAALDTGFDPDARDEQGNTPLMVAEDPRVARRLISAGADVNARNANGSTPLIEAAKYCHLEVVRLLLQSGADVNARDEKAENVTALDWAHIWGPDDENYEEVVKVLREAGGVEARSR